MRHFLAFLHSIVSVISMRPAVMAVELIGNTGGGGRGGRTDPGLPWDPGAVKPQVNATTGAQGVVGVLAQFYHSALRFPAAGT